MDLGNLEVFLAIHQHGSINQAAQSLYLAQSTVTHRLQQLEKHVGGPLFIRSKSGVSLSSLGRRFYPVASAMLEQWQMFHKQNQLEETLSIVAGKAFASYELPRLLGAYSRSHPAFTCYVRSTLYEESVHALLTGSADIAFLGHEVYHPQLAQIFLPADRILLAVSPKHPWAAEFPGFQAWGNQPTIAFSNKTAPYRQRVDRFLAEHGVYPRVMMELDSFRAVKQMVMQNLGVTLLPERTFLQERETGSLVAHDIAEGTLTRPTLISYPHHKTNDPRFMQFVDWIIAHYPQPAAT
ncbi:LysR family transcriptional regulator [Brevibacillus migulae]|uniref:LysR family transcriptional regulator n=1 Tax=Brevibacillus migulae TaxID=1644114 RepID=UPI00106E8A25|nr:LysR family transcriptional regulator [Brevibacillus migulae]